MSCEGTALLLYLVLYLIIMFLLGMRVTAIHASYMPRATRSWPAIVISVLLPIRTIRMVALASGPVSRHHAIGVNPCVLRLTPT